MLREADKYTYRVMWSDEDNEYVGLCAEFPGLSWLDETPEDALKGIRSIVKKCVKDLAQTGEPVPQAITTKQYSGKFMVRVPPEVHRRLVVKAAEEGVSLNRVVSSKLAQ
jgi:predicted HicB family RNase H-like nuclease